MNNEELNNEIDDNVVITRYMSFDRFSDMCKKGLFLVNPCVFDDNYEGSPAIIAILDKIPDKNIQNNINIAKSNFFVSCWHKDKEENMAMWKIYGKKTNSLCIETNLEQLISIASDYGKCNEFHNIYLSEIQYIRFEKGEFNALKPKIFWDYWDSVGKNMKNCKLSLLLIKTLQGLTLKHKAYHYEKEIRLICDTITGNVGKTISSNSFKGIRMTLTKNFFRKITLSPNSSSNLVKKIKKVLKKYKYSVPKIETSVLNSSK